MSELVKNLIKRFEYNRKHKKNYLLMLLVMAVLIAGGVTWGLKLTGVSVTAEDTEVADALETYGLLQGASPEEGTQETESTEVSQEEVKQEQETSQIEDTQETTEVSTELTEDTKTEEDQPFELDTDAVDGITVTVSGDRSSLPYPADELEVRAEEVTDADVVSLCNQLMEENEVQADKQYLLSLSLYHGEEEVEPTGNVTVTFGGLDTENYEPSVYNIDTETEDAEDMDAEADEDGDVAVETETFASNYAVSLYSEDAKIGKAINGGIDTNTFSTDEDFYYLSGNVWTANSITITADTTIDLNGKGFYFTGTGNLFDVQGGTTLTIVDNGIDISINNEDDTNQTSVAQDGRVVFDSGTTTVKSLIYYVTDSKENGLTTTESRKKYTVTGAGFIVGENGGATSLVNVEENGTFCLKGGILTMKDNSASTNSRMVFNSGKMKMSGGYIVNGKAAVWGAGIYSNGIFEMSGGVITGNYGSNGGGVCINGDGEEKKQRFTMTGGYITGNGTKSESITVSKKYDRGLGGGIFIKEANAVISGGYITNNKENYACSENGSGCHGGGGIATFGGTLEIQGGKITANYSAEAGGGIYVGHYDYVYPDKTTENKDQKATFLMKGGIVAGNDTKKSEGGGIRISGGTTGTIDASEKIYITNNRTETTFDWGGGGIFVQSKGELTVKNSLISSNKADGYGGGVGACPTGKTLLADSEGAAIYENQAEGTKFSAGGQGKNGDELIAAVDQVFTKDKRYKDYFCVKDKSSSEYISLVTGKMLGGEAANWIGCCDGKPVEISKNGYAAAKYLFGLNSNPDGTAIDKAKAAAKVFITGNSSTVHGGGIMTNGDLILGTKKSSSAVPAIDISGTKAMHMENESKLLESGLGFTFKVVYNNTYKNEKQEVGTVTSNDKTGKFSIAIDKSVFKDQDTDSTEDKTYSREFWLEEVNDNKVNISYDQTKYKLVVTVQKSIFKIADIAFTSYQFSNIQIIKVDSQNTESELTSQTYKVHYQISSNRKNMYAWKSGTGGTEVLNNAWPGKEMQEDTLNAGWYTAEIPKSLSGTFNCIFSNNGADKTSDITGISYTNNEVWIINESTISYSAPDGWKEDTSSSNVEGRYTLTCDEDGNYSVELPNATFINIKKYEYELPATGGTGTIKFTIGGLLIAAGSLWYGYSMKRRRERRAG